MRMTVDSVVVTRPLLTLKTRKSDARFTFSSTQFPVNLNFHLTFYLIPVSLAESNVIPTFGWIPNSSLLSKINDRCG